jgi:hypothetical protein
MRHLFRAGGSTFFDNFEGRVRQGRAPRRDPVHWEAVVGGDAAALSLCDAGQHGIDPRVFPSHEFFFSERSGFVVVFSMQEACSKNCRKPMVHYDLLGKKE